jgi:hypothetical protein
MLSKLYQELIGVPVGVERSNSLAMDTFAERIASDFPTALPSTSPATLT